MLKARLLLVALLVPLAGAFALLGGTGVLHGAALAPYDVETTAVQAALRGVTAELANATVDAATKAASDPTVIAAITKKDVTPKAAELLLAPAGVFGAPTFALVVSADGAVVGRTGAENKLPASLAGLPVVAESLGGLARDGLWLDGDKPVHIVASASYAGENLVGGVVLGWVYNQELVEALRKFVQLPVFVTSASGVIGALGELTEENVRTRDSGVSTSAPLPILVPDGHRFVAASAPLYPGDATVAAVAVIDRDPALAGIASFQLGLIALTGALALLILVIVASTIRAVSKPIDIIVDHLSQVQQGASVGILPETGLSGQFLRLGKQINMLLQSPRAGTAPLGGLAGALGASSPPIGAGLFGSTPTLDAPSPAKLPITTSQSNPAPVAPAPYGFGASLPGSAPASLPTASLPAPSAGPLAPPATSAAPSALAGLFDEPDPLAAFRVPPKTAAPPPAPVPAEAPPGESEMNPEATVMFQVPQSLLAASQGQPAPAPPPPPPGLPPQMNDDADDNRTVVAQVPQELLSQSAPKRDDPAAADAAHYKEVYEKFVQTRIECNEDTSDLSYDRFVAKLLKNRQQILEKHNAKGVRFQVYVKDGKAALRALPVRD